MTARPSSVPPAERTNRPDSTGTLSRSAIREPRPMRFGPAVAPTVLIQTTSERSRPRRSGALRSVAANRAWRFAALPKPSSSPEATSSQNARVPAASTTPPAPAAATSIPSDRAGRRPRATAIRTRAGAATAAPSVMAVVTDPAQAREPESSTASSDPVETTAPAPIPLNTWATESRVRVRRCWEVRTGGATVASTRPKIPRTATGGPRRNA